NEGNNRDWNDDNDQLGDFWEEMGIRYGLLSNSSSTTTWESWDSFGLDTDNDQIPDAIEIKIKELFEETYQNGNDDHKRAIYRAFKGIRQWEDFDADGIFTSMLYTDGTELYRREQRHKDLDADGNGIDDKEEIINFEDFDQDGQLNWQDMDSDNDGGDDNWDWAVFDSRGHRDLDFDFVSDWEDLDMDGDTITNDSERPKGGDPEKVDTDGDGVNDAIDYYAHDKRYQNKNDILNDLKFTQIGTESNWKFIDTWNYGQVGGSYAAINELGELYVWGLNYGSLPFDGGNEKAYEYWNSGVPFGFTKVDLTKIRSDITWNKISLGNGFGLGTDIENKIYAWGKNLSSQLGIGKPTTFVNFTSPKLFLGDIELISSGDQQTAIINEDGKLRMIGSNDQGQLGTGASPFNYPRDLDWSEIPNGIKDVKVTATETFIIDDLGYLWAYGDNDLGQLGRGIASTAAENFTAKKVVNTVGQNDSTNEWDEIFAYSRQVYAFKKDKTLWAWGNNKNFALGINKSKDDYLNKIPFESVPTKIENVNKDDILITDGELQFTAINGGFIFLKKKDNTGKGELWAAGDNFFTGKFFKIKTPRKIGNEEDWVKIHDIKTAQKNILIEKSDGSIWGAGANWDRVLTNDPCPDPIKEIWHVNLTVERQKQIFQFELSNSFTGTASLNLYLGDIKLTTSLNIVTTVDNVISGIQNSFNNLNLNSKLSLTTVNSQGGNKIMKFEAQDYTYYKVYSTLTNKSEIFSGNVTSTEDIQKNYSGEVTYKLILNGKVLEVKAGASNELNSNQIKDEVYTSLKNLIENYTITQAPFTANTETISDTVYLVIERDDYQAFNVQGNTYNSLTSSSTFKIEKISSSYVVENCNDGMSFINKLTKIFDGEEYNWKKISVGVNHALGLTKDGKVYSWGRNNQGQLGLGSESFNFGEPKLIPTISTLNFKDISASAEVSFAITTSGTMYAWGDNDLGSLGVGNNTDASVPKVVTEGVTWIKNLGGYKFQVAIKDNVGSEVIQGWGYQKYGELGALGKVKSDIVTITTDLNESEGVIKTTPDGEYLLMTEKLLNYINTKLNFEYQYNESNSTSKKKSKSNSSKNNNTGKYMNVGKWKVKRKVPAFEGKSAIGREEGFQMTSFMPYGFDIIDVNEPPSDIILENITSKVSSKSDMFISNIKIIDPDIDDIVTASIPENSPNKEKFSIKNDKLYFNTKSNKSLVPYNFIIRATDWEGRVLEKLFEILIDEEGNLLVEEQNLNESSGGSSYYNSRYIDSDGDGFNDSDEILMGTDQFDFRSFPKDFDNDGILDFYDGDIDNDGYLNENDLYPFDSSEWADSDQDGIGDNQDNDDDNDGIPDLSVNWRDDYIIQDLFPNDPNESFDFDRDGIGDNSDPDDDNDGIDDILDDFPFNPYEWKDTDGDGIGDNNDQDADNDGYSNFDEVFLGTNPLDSLSYPEDLDKDFVPDLLDSDIDGDDISNEYDNAPFYFNPDQKFIQENENFIQIKPSEFFSPNGDGINDVWVIDEILRYPNNKIWVYDSNGNLVLQSSKYMNDWNGELDGVPLPEGPYLYIINLNGNETNDVQGWLYITR
ncbi:MAG: gliding motility-associated C-terminal domain-containing protein, partial [Candidatus Woesearchaeota archaeon]